MCAPDAPTPPDPQETSAAQTGTNIGTAIANNTMQLIDQVTPNGNLDYEIQGYQTYEDPYTGQSYEIPQYLATTSLNDQQQQTLDASQAAQTNLAELAQDRSDFLLGYLPGTESVTDQIDSKLFDLGSSRLDPRFERERAALETRLANQGITAGSEAWQTEMDQFSQGKNDAYNSLMLQGRGQALAEVNQPINQITALLSGSQVSNPAVSMAQPSGAATTDVAGLINQNYNQQLQNYQIQSANSGSLLGGLFGLGASAISGGLFG